MWRLDRLKVAKQLVFDEEKKQLRPPSFSESLNPIVHFGILYALVDLGYITNLGSGILFKAEETLQTWLSTMFSSA